MEIENLRAEVSRLKTSLNSLSNYKARTRIQKDMKNEFPGELPSTDQILEKDEIIKNLESQLQQRNNQIAKMVSEKDSLIMSNKRLIDGMLKNKTQSTIHLSHTIEQLLDRKRHFESEIQGLKAKIAEFEKLGKKVRKDMQIQTPKIKLDMDWLQSISASKKQGDGLGENWVDSSPFEIIPSQNLQEIFQNSEKLSNFGQLSLPQNDENVGGVRGEQRRELTTFQMENLSYSPPQNRNFQNLKNPNFENVKYFDHVQANDGEKFNLVDRLQETGLSEIKEREEVQFENVNQKVENVQISNPKFASLNPETLDFEGLKIDVDKDKVPILMKNGDYDEFDSPKIYENSQKIKVENELQIDIRGENLVDTYDEFDCDDTDPYDNSSHEIKNSEVLENRKFDLIQSDLLNSETGIYNTQNRVNAFDQLRAEFAEKRQITENQNSEISKNSKKDSENIINEKNGSQLNLSPIKPENNDSDEGKLNGIYIRDEFVDPNFSQNEENLQNFQNFSKHEEILGNNITQGSQNNAQNHQIQTISNSEKFQNPPKNKLNFGRRESENPSNQNQNFMRQRNESYDLLREKIGRKILKKSVNQTNFPRNLQNEPNFETQIPMLKEMRYRTKSDNNVVSSNSNPFLTKAHTTEFPQNFPNFENSEKISNENIESEINKALGIHQPQNPDFSLDSLKELLEENEGYDSQELDEGDSIITEGDHELLDVEKPKNKNFEKLDIQDPLIQALQSYSGSGKSINAYDDDMEGWIIEDRLAIQKKMKMVKQRERGDLINLETYRCETESKKAPKKALNLSEEDSEKNGIFYDIPQAIRNYESIKQEINRGRKNKKNRKISTKFSKNQKNSKMQEKVKKLKNREIKLLKSSNKKSFRPTNLFSPKSSIQSNLKNSKFLESVHSNRSAANLIPELKYNFEKRRNTTQPSKLNIIGSEKSGNLNNFNDFNRPLIEENHEFSMQNPSSNNQQYFSRNSNSPQFQNENFDSNSQICFFSPSNGKMKPVEKINPQLVKSNFKSSDLNFERQNFNIEELLSHNSILKNQKKRILGKKKKKIAKSHLKKPKKGLRRGNKHFHSGDNLRQLPYRYNGGYSKPSYLGKSNSKNNRKLKKNGLKKQRKVPRVDCNFDKNIESKILSARSKKSKSKMSNNWMSLIETTGLSKRGQKSGSSSKIKSLMKKSNLKLSRNRHNSPGLNIYSEIYDSRELLDESQQNSLYQNWTERSRHHSPSSINLAGHLPKRSLKPAKIGINRPKWSRVKYDRCGHKKYKGQGLTKKATKILERIGSDEMFDTNSPHHPNFLESLGNGKHKISYNRGIVGDLSSKNLMTLSRASRSQIGFQIGSILKNEKFIFLEESEISNQLNLRDSHSQNYYWILSDFQN